MGLEKLWKAIEAGQAANAGKLPVIEYKSSTLEKIGKGTTRIPNFTIVSWIDKPAGMGQSDEEYTAQVAAPPAPAPAPMPAPKPVPAKTVMAAAIEDDEMF